MLDPSQYPAQLFPVAMSRYSYPLSRSSALPDSVPGTRSSWLHPHNADPNWNSTSLTGVAQFGTSATSDRSTRKNSSEHRSLFIQQPAERLLPNITRAGQIHSAVGLESLWHHSRGISIDWISYRNPPDTMRCRTVLFTVEAQDIRSQEKARASGSVKRRNTLLRRRTSVHLRGLPQSRRRHPDRRRKLRLRDRWANS
jgi:hypothetical protein